MGITHFDQICVANGLFVGEKGSETRVLNGSADQAIGRIFLAANDFPKTAVEGTPNTFQSVGSQPAEFANINTTGLYGFGCTDGDLITSNFIRVPNNMDVTAAMNVNVLWVPIDGTVANGVTWLVKYGKYTPETTALAAPATALSTVIAEDAENDTPYTVQLSPTGVIAANTFAVGDLIAFLIESDVVDSSNNPGCWFLGLLLSYTKRFQ